MKKVIGVFSLLMCMSTQLLAASANDLVLIYRVPAADQEKIYSNFVDKTIVADKTGHQVRNYHVTVGWFRNVGKAEKFRKFMKKELSNQVQFNYNFKEAGILNASPQCPDPKNPKNPLNKKCNRNAVVLLADDDSLVTLRKINQNLNDAADRYNRDLATEQERKNGIKYKMDLDLLPPYFAPHITLANTDQIKSKADRAKALIEVNDQMQAHPDFYTTVMNKKKK